MKILQIVPVLLGLASFAAALVPREIDTQLDKRARSCRNGPNSRNCWYGKYDINTDYENEWPDTGDVVDVRNLILPRGDSS
jgi:hypothetical protein